MSRGVDMITAHPYRAVAAVLTVMVVTGFTAGMIGQDGDGPWGGLPDWLGTATYTVFMLSALAMVLLSVFLLVAHLRWRARSGAGRHAAT